jgi:hypothetical protein
VLKRKALSLAAILLFLGVPAFSQNNKPNWDALEDRAGGLDGNKQRESR